METIIISKNERRGLEDLSNGNVMSHNEAKKIFHDITP